MSRPTERDYVAAARAYCLVRFSYDLRIFADLTARDNAVMGDALSVAQQPEIRALVDAAWSRAQPARPLVRCIMIEIWRPSIVMTCRIPRENHAALTRS